MHAAWPCRSVQPRRRWGGRVPRVPRVPHLFPVVPCQVVVGVGHEGHEDVAVVRLALPHPGKGRGKGGRAGSSSVRPPAWLCSALLSGVASLISQNHPAGRPMRSPQTPAAVHARPMYRDAVPSSCPTSPARLACLPAGPLLPQQPACLLQTTTAGAAATKHCPPLPPYCGCSCSGCQHARPCLPTLQTQLPLLLPASHPPQYCSRWPTSLISLVKEKAGTTQKPGGQRGEQATAAPATAGQQARRCAAGGRQGCVWRGVTRVAGGRPARYTPDV